VLVEIALVVAMLQLIDPVEPTEKAVTFDWLLWLPESKHRNNAEMPANVD